MPNEPTNPEPLPTTGRLMGIDYGTKRLGVSISNDEQTIASPLENYTRQSRNNDAAFLAKISGEYSAVGIVIGLPVHMSGDEGGKAKEARRFGKWVGEATQLPVAWHDERYTSLIAANYLMSSSLSSKKQKSKLDMVAAQVLLQSFLDAKDRTAPPRPLDEGDPATDVT